MLSLSVFQVVARNMINGFQVAAVAELWEKNKENPVIPKNQPPVCGAIMWYEPHGRLLQKTACAFASGVAAAARQSLVFSQRISSGASFSVLLRLLKQHIEITRTSTSTMPHLRVFLSIVHACHRGDCTHPPPPPVTCPGDHSRLLCPIPSSGLIPPSLSRVLIQNEKNEK